MKVFYIFLLVGFFSTEMLAQSILENYNWETKPAKIIQKEAQKKLPEYGAFEIIKNEFTYEEKQFVEFVLMHTKKVINSDEAIERNNRIYFSTASHEEVLKNNVRIIAPNGNVTELDKSDIKQSEDEKSGSTLNYFAVKGLEKGSVIEYLKLTKRMPRLTGYPVPLQHSYPLNKVEFEIIYPSHLVFEHKIVNDDTEMVKSSEKYKDRVSETLIINDVPPIWEERYAVMEKHRKCIFFKLVANTFNAKYDLNSYASFVDEFKEAIMPIQDKKERRLIKKYISRTKFSGETDKDLVTIENKIKTDFRILDQYNDGTTFLEGFKSKNLSILNATRLLATIFEIKNITFEYLLTSNRAVTPFLEDFESYSFLNEIGFYFPETDGYMGVQNNVSHYPVLFHNWMNNNALFIKKEKIGKNELYMPEVRFIEIPDSDFTVDYQNITVDFTEDISNPTIDTKIEFNGFSAYGLQPSFDYMTQENEQDFLKSIASNYSGLDNVEGFDFVVNAENKGRESVFEKPFILNISFKGEDLIEKAGNTVIFAVGKIIGKQVELYQKEKRQFPVEMNYPHTYHRKIILKLPKGYSVKNLDDLKVNHVLNTDGKEIAKFTTKYSQQGDVVTIENLEFYKQIEFPISVYETYSKVINAAADFNKIKLVIEK